MVDNAVFSWVALQAQFSCSQPLLFLWCTAAFKRENVAWQLIVKTTCGDIWMAYRRLQPRKKKWSWRKTSKIWKGGTAVQLDRSLSIWSFSTFERATKILPGQACFLEYLPGWRLWEKMNIDPSFNPLLLARNVLQVYMYLSCKGQVSKTQTNKKDQTNKNSRMSITSC